MKKIYTIQFPLEWEWQVITSPANHVPSHYTHALWMTYAFDFAKIEDTKISNIEKLFWFNTQSYAGWWANILAPTEWKVVCIKQDCDDRINSNFFIDLFSGIKTLFFWKNRRDFEAVFWNYVIIQSTEYFVVFAHLQKDSVQVQLWDTVKAGQKLATIWHSWSSQKPHLHMQLMDSIDFSTANWIPVNFEWEILEEATWRYMEKSIPKRGTVVRRVTSDFREII